MTIKKVKTGRYSFSQYAKKAGFKNRSTVYKWQVRKTAKELKDEFGVRLVFDEDMDKWFVEVL